MVVKKGVIAVIPAYNEEGRIGKVVREARKYVETVIVVDDGSTDRTAEEARKEGAIVIRHSRNKGKGEALKTGLKAFEERNGKYLIFIDGDGQHDPKKIPEFVNLLESGADVVVGRRDQRKMPVVRKISNRLTSFLLKILFNVNVSDTQCGYRGFRREVFGKIDIRESRFNVESQMLVDAAREGLKIEEVEIPTIYGEEKSKVKPYREIPGFAWFLIREIVKSLILAIKRHIYLLT